MFTVADYSMDNHFFTQWMQTDVDSLWAAQIEKKKKLHVLSEHILNLH